MADQPAVLSLEEKNRILHHLGYTSVNRQTVMGLGYPTAVQTMFLAETSLEHIPESAIGSVRRTLALLDDLEAQQFSAVKRLRASSIGNITLNPRELDQIEKELRRWAFRLAEDLGAPVNGAAARFSGGAGGGLNLPIHREG